MQNKPNDHHFIPVFYLKQWASASMKKIIEYSIKHGNFISKPAGPKSTGFQTGLYSFPELPPDSAQFIEDKFFRTYDNAASLAHQRILAWDKSEWPPKMIQAWARCVMHILLRHPDVIAEMRPAVKAIWTATGPDAQKQYEAEVKKRGDPDTLDEYLRKSDPHVGTKVLVNMIIHAIDNETVGNAIVKMIWQVVDVTRSSKTLLTSDRPVIINNLGKEDAIIIMPVSPTKLFVAVNRQQTADALLKRKPLTLVESINEITVGRARRYVWARDDWQSWYVRQNMGKRKEPTPLFPNLSKYNAS